MTDKNGDDALAAFQEEVASLKLSGGSSNPERTGTAWGIVLLVVGAAIATIGLLFNQGDAGVDDATELLGELVTSANTIILVAFGLTLAVIGVAIFIRNSITRYLRYWLIRLIYEDRANTDRLIAALKEGD